MSKKELEAKTKKELSEICKEMGLPRYKGKTEISKVEMIENILANLETKEADVKQDEPVAEVKEEVVPAVEEKTLEELKKEFCDKPKEQYIESATVGTLIAFLENNGKPNTAALVNRSSSRKQLKLETQYGKQFIIPYSQVLWVRTTTKWPNGVYKLLKNKGKDQVAADENKEGC